MMISSVRQWAIGLCLSSTFIVHAEEIHLKDGSRIQGEVLSMSNGVYRIQTDSLGVVSLPKTQILSIGDGSKASSSPEPAAVGQVDAIQSSIVNNSAMMNRVRRLQNDPDMVSVLNDPEVMKAVQSFDLKALANHPKIQKLMNNSEVKRIKDGVN